MVGLNLRELNVSFEAVEALDNLYILESQFFETFNFNEVALTAIKCCLH